MEKIDKTLLPFLQKVYSALRHLNNFSVSNDFNDNISDLDGFFTEYRSSTFALQKSLGGNSNPVYQKNLKDYLLKDESVSGWMNKKRNDSVHEQPFNLHKHLLVMAYSATSSEIILEKEYTIEFDEPFEKLQNDLVADLEKQNPVEVNFSVMYFFTEEDKTVDVFVLSMKAIKMMMAFMVAMFEDLKVSDETCAALLNKNIDLANSIRNNNFTFVRDYCFLTKKHQFIGGEVLESNIPYCKMPIEKIYENLEIQRLVNEDFAFFVLIHSQIYLKQERHIAPTFFVKYADDTVAIVSFDASLRTTFYRKINEIALKVISEDIESVYYVSEFVFYGSVSSVRDVEALMGMPYIERQQNAKKTALAFYEINKNGVKSIFAEGEQVNELLSMEDVMQFKKEYNTAYHCFLTPLIVAFATKRDRENVSKC